MPEAKRIAARMASASAMETQVIVARTIFDTEA